MMDFSCILRSDCCLDLEVPSFRYSLMYNKQNEWKERPQNERVIMYAAAANDKRLL